MTMIFSSVVTVLVILFTNSVLSLNLKNGDVNLVLEAQDVAVRLQLLLGDEEKLSGLIGGAFNLQLPSDCEGLNACNIDGDGATLSIFSEPDGGFILSWRADDPGAEFFDCFDLLSSETHWSGGPEHWNAIYPIETTKLENWAYITTKNDYGAVSERYWLNSKGAYIFVDDNVPLFVDQNNMRDDAICFRAKVETPYLNREKNVLDYLLVAKPDAKQAHLHAINEHLGKPTGHPNDNMIKEPIWTTWAKYKKDITDEIVRNFAADIADKGFVGQIEIDDYWETCYGSLAFNSETFPSIGETVQVLHDLNFTVTLWTHPFVNEDCVEFANYGKENDLFVKDIDGNSVVSWWDGEPAYHIDYTKEEGAQWFVERLKGLQAAYNIDNFKFDAGESDWAPTNPILQGDPEFAPNILTEAYVRTCALFGDRLEVRAGWRTQDLPVFVRMIDKDSRWGLDNGLHALIETTIQMNMVGYTIVLPDMVGGNGYGELPTSELLVRWLATNVFLPTIQLSFLPWEFPSDDFDILALTQKFIRMHEDYSGEILAAIQNSIENGSPVNPPIWWVDPLNPTAWTINDEFLLGEGILVAPVVQEGATSRSIYLPAGLWQDANTGELHQGPLTIEEYPAPIDVLPYFIKI